MNKYLIVNADDFGISPGVSQGIIECYQHGIVTSTTVMANIPHAKEAIELAQKSVPQMGLGLHITLSYGSSLLPPDKIPSLVDAKGNFYAFPLAAVAKFDARELKAEIQAQFQRFVELTNTVPDHLDTHQFMANMHPGAFEAMLQLAHKHKIPIRNGEMFLDIEKLQAFMKTRGTAEIAGFDKRIPILQKIYKEKPPHWTDYFEYNFYDKTVNIQNLQNILENLPVGVTELMCHPGYARDLANDTYLLQREQEIKVLTNAKIQSLIAKLGIQLINFSQIPVSTLSKQET